MINPRSCVVRITYVCKCVLDCIIANGETILHPKVLLHELQMYL